MTTYLIKNATAWGPAFVEAMTEWSAKKKLREYLDGQVYDYSESEWLVEKVVDGVQLIKSAKITRF